MRGTCGCAAAAASFSRDYKGTDYMSLSNCTQHTPTIFLRQSMYKVEATGVPKTHCTVKIDNNVDEQCIWWCGRWWRQNMLNMKPLKIAARKDFGWLWKWRRGGHCRDQREWVFEVREVKSENKKLSLFFEKRETRFLNRFIPWKPIKTAETDGLLVG